LHWVEVDLLRGGARPRIPVPLPEEADYCCYVAQATPAGWKTGSRQTTRPLMATHRRRLRSARVTPPSSATCCASAACERKGDAAAFEAQSSTGCCPRLFLPKLIPRHVSELPESAHR